LTEHILIERTGQAAIVTINRPERIRMRSPGTTAGPLVEWWLELKARLGLAKEITL
jgi:hypothetical protein